MRTIRIVALAALIISASPIRAATEPTPTARLAQQLGDAHFARIGIDAKTLVLVKPRVAPVGLEYERVQGHPTRPAIVAGADWDSLPLPPNPIPWDRIDQIESGVRNRSKGALIGGSLGLLTGIAVGGAALARGNDVYGYGALFAAAGAAVGAMFPTTKWKHVYLEPVAEPVRIDRLEKQQRDATDQTARLDQQLRWAQHTRIDVEGHTFELFKPRVGAEGLAYERIPGFPRQRPALVAGADWDSVAMPSNPIPWSQIDRIETGFPAGTHGARDGALIGLLAGVVTGAIALATADVHSESFYPPAVIFGAVVICPLLGAFAGSAFHTTRWEQVYPESKPAAR